MARVAIGITAGGNAHQGGAVCGKARAVAHGVARLQLLRADQARGQRHGGLQAPVRCRVLGVVGGAAVQGDARAHPVGVHRWGARALAQRGGAVAQAALAGQVLRGGVEGRHLVGNAARAVGIAEVGHERDFIDLRQRVQPRPGAAKALGRKAQAVHAGVHFQEHAVRHLRFVRGQHVDLLVAVDGVPQGQARAQLQVARLEHALDQQDGAAPAQLAHALGLAQVQQGKAVSAAQTIKHLLYAVAVGVGLDHGPDLGVSGSSACARQVVLQGRGVDTGVDGARHGGRLREDAGDSGTVAPAGA